MARERTERKFTEAETTQQFLERHDVASRVGKGKNAKETKSATTKKNKKGDKNKKGGIKPKFLPGKQDVDPEALTLADIEYKKKKEAELAEAEKERIKHEKYLAEMAKQAPPENLPVVEEKKEKELDSVENGDLILIPPIDGEDDEDFDTETPILANGNESEVNDVTGSDYEEVLTIGNPTVEAPPVPPPLPTPESASIPEPILNREEVPAFKYSELLVGAEAKQSAWKSFKEASVEKVAPAWRFARERAQGVLTFGVWELHKAEDFRVSTNDLATGLESGSAAIRQESGRLSHEEALREAERMNSLLKTLNETETISATQYESASAIVSNEKIQANQAFEDSLVNKTLEQVKDKFKDKTNYRGQPILTSERLIQIEEEVRSTSKALRHSQMTRDLINYQQLFRKNLDPEWYKRYVASGLEAALGLAAVAVITPVAGTKIGTWWGGRAVKSAVGKGVGHIAQEHQEEVINKTKNLFDLFKSKVLTSPVRLDDLVVPEGPISPESADLNKNVWHTVKEYLVRSGVENPTNAQVLEAAKEAAKENNIAVKEWGISGEISDRELKPGSVLSLKKVAIKAALWTGKKAVKAAYTAAMEG